MSTLKKIINRDLRLKFYYPFHLLYIKAASFFIRRKNSIKVLFVLGEKSIWKSEALYKLMLGHPRFEPILGVTTSLEVPGSKEPLILYLESKDYPFVDLDESDNSINEINPDIIIYYKPYSNSIPEQHVYWHHLRRLIVYVNYAFNTMGNKLYINPRICDFAWIQCIENELVAKRKREMIGIIRSHNLYITGLPIQDSLMIDKTKLNNPWKMQPGKKRIIYAPHHSLKEENKKGIQYSTFLEFGDYMLYLAKRYKDQVQFAFKPHPSLHKKLVKIWGENKTNAYYKEWETLENTQYESGEYMGLFAHSDAMIHDCASFQIEYLYTKNPVLYLVTGSHNTEEMNEFGRRAFEMHYLAKNENQIERFITNIINDIDVRKNERLSFYNNYLLPPNNSSACNNIIRAILGHKE